jgi:formimidoylglutamate deiminase
MNEPRPNTDSLQTFHARGYFSQGHWLPDVRVQVNDGGQVVAIDVNQNPRDGDIRCSWLIPAMVNAHSHVFQRAMAGQAEFRRSQHDDFWSWRERMYALANAITPEELHDLACWTYAEMLANGYGAVCEFHYLQRSGANGTNTTALAEAVMAAADEVGMALTVLPVLYRYSGFGQQPLRAEQQRFGLSVEAYLSVLETLSDQLRSRQRLGVCFHSLRAVSEADMRAVLANTPQDWPVHLHIAEQTAEVQDSQQALGTRPVQWLLDHFGVDERWNLVHATHMDGDETRQLAESGAVAVLCPSTEANLGDGVFPLAAFQRAGGRYSLGSDSNIELNPARECQLLEYSQRLLEQRRVVAGDGNGIRPTRAIHAGDALWHSASRGGWQSMHGRPAAEGILGQAADWLELDERHPLLNQAEESRRLDTFVFAAPEAVKRSWIGGRCVAVAGEVLEAEIRRQQGLRALHSLKKRLNG